MPYAITFTNPEYIYTNGAAGASESVEVTAFQFDNEANRSGYCDLFIPSDVAAKYLHETLASNPIQLNSQVEVVKEHQVGTGLQETVFRGYVREKPEFVEILGQRYLRLQCGDPMTMLSDVVVPASATGPYSLIVQTDAVRLPAGSAYMPMVPFKAGSTDHYGTYTQETLWPDPADADGDHAYLQDADCNTATTGALAAGATTITLTSSGAAFTPRGWAKLADGVNTEWIYYDGVWYDTVGAAWKLEDCVRGCLGTVDGNHAAGPYTIYNKLPKWIAPGDFELQVNDGGGWDSAAYGNEYVQATKTGCLIYHAAVAGKTFQAYHYIYDSDLQAGGAFRASVTDVLERILQAPREAGGAGIDSANIDIDAYFDTQYITRFTLKGDEKHNNAALIIRNFLEQLGYLSTGNVTADEVAFFYDANADTFRLVYLPGVGAASYTIDGVHAIQKDMNIGDLYSAVLVRYSEDQEGSLLQTALSWHEACGGAGQPDHYSRCIGKDFNPIFDYLPSKTTSQLAGSFGHDAMIDWSYDEHSLIQSRCTQVWQGQTPNSPNDIPHSYWWFNANADAATIKRIRAVVGLYRRINAANQTAHTASPYHIEVKIVGCTTWNAAAKTPLFSTGGWQDVTTFQEIAPSEDPFQRELIWDESNILNQGPFNCIALLFRYMAGPYDNVDYYDAPCYQLEVQGSMTGQGAVYVQLTDDGTISDPAYLYYPDAYRKLRAGYGASFTAGTGEIPGVPRVLTHTVQGGCSPGAALSIGRALLEGHLIYYSMRHYEYEGPELAHVPQVGERLTVVEDVLYGAIIPAAGRHIGDLFTCTGTPGGLWQWDGTAWNHILSDYGPTYTGVIQRVIYSVGEDGRALLKLTMLDYAGDIIA